MNQKRIRFSGWLLVSLIFWVLCGVVAAQIKITALPAASAVTTDDLLMIVNAPGGSAVTQKITVANFKTSIFASPTFVTPTLGAALATSINGNTFTAGTYTLTGTAGKVFTFNNTLTLAGTDGSTLNVGAGGTLGTNAFTSTAFESLANKDAASGYAGLTAGSLLKTAEFPAFSGDVSTTAGGVTTVIGATKVTSVMLNSDVFSTAHSWSGQQTFTAPTLGTPASGVATNLTGTASGLTAGNVTTNANLTGDVTSVGNATNIATGVIVNADINGSAAIDATKIADGTVTSAEFQFINTLGSNAQTQLDAKAPLASPTFTGTVVIPTPFTIGAVSMTATGTQLNFLAAATGTTGTTSTNLVFSASPTFTGTVAGAAFTASSTIVQTSNSAAAFESGPNGSTNPVLRLVNSTASQADGVSITGGAAGGGTTFTALSSGADSGFIFVPKGTPSAGLTVQIQTGARLNLYTTSGSNAASRNWTWRSDQTAFGDIGLYQSTALAGDPMTAGNRRLYISATGAIGVGAVAPAGFGVPAIYGVGRSTAQTAAVGSVATYTVGAADGSFEVSANVNVTTATTHSFSVTVTYTDETNTSRTLTLPMAQLAGTFITAITNVTGAGPYESAVLHIRCKASTAITVATTGTFTAVTYNVEGVIKQTA